MTVSLPFVLSGWGEGMIRAKWISDLNLKSGEPHLTVRPVGVAAAADLVAVHPVPLAVRLVQAAADPERPPVVARDCFGGKVTSDVFRYKLQGDQSDLVPFGLT